MKNFLSDEGRNAAKGGRGFSIGLIPADSYEPHAPMLKNDYRSSYTSDNVILTETNKREWTKIFRTVGEETVGKAQRYNRHAPILLADQYPQDYYWTSTTPMTIMLQKTITASQTLNLIYDIQNYPPMIHKAAKDEDFLEIKFAGGSFPESSLPKKKMGAWFDREVVITYYSRTEYKYIASNRFVISKRPEPVERDSYVIANINNLPSEDITFKQGLLDINLLTLYGEGFRLLDEEEEPDISAVSVGTANIRNTLRATETGQVEEAQKGRSFSFSLFPVGSRRGEKRNINYIMNDSTQRMLSEDDEALAYMEAGKTVKDVKKRLEQLLLARETARQRIARENARYGHIGAPGFSEDWWYGSGFL